MIAELREAKAAIEVALPPAAATPAANPPLRKAEMAVAATVPPTAPIRVNSAEFTSSTALLI